MAGLVPAIHALLAPGEEKDVDARDKPGHDVVRVRSQQRKPLTRFLLPLPAALVSFFISSLPAFADLKL
jgi:hypothetical protein